MQDNDTTPRKRRRVTVRRVTMVLLLVGVVAFTVFRLSLGSKLQSRIAAIRAAGYPVTCAELDQWYRIPPDAENAADTITDAFSYYVEPRDTKRLPLAGRAGLPARTEPLAEETRVVVAQYLTDNKEALELLHIGAEIENCRYPVDLSAGPEALFHHLSSLRNSIRLLNVEVISHAGSNPRLSARSVMSGFGLTQSLEKEPMLVSQLVRIACQDLTVSTLKYLVNRTDFTDEQLGELSQAVVKAQAPSALSRAFVGERCSSLAMLKMPPARASYVLSITSGRSPKSGADAHLATFAFALHRFAGLTDRSTIIYLDLMEDYIEATQLPPGKRRTAIEAIDIRRRVASGTDLLLGHLMPAFATVDTINLRGIAHLHAAQAALAIQRYRLAANELPVKLAELVPTYLDGVPKDPFDGQELRYKKLEPGFVVYSIGQDLSDDGGKEIPPRNKRRRGSSNWDVTFTVER
ncbi:MAG: hypothetical protein ACYSWW_12285 [Planctomycetota bacterium]